MARSPLEFQRIVGHWARKSQGRMTAILRESVQALCNEIRRPVGEGGNMPVKTGNLRRSMRASLTDMPKPSDKKKFADGGNQITLTIAKLKLGGTIYIGFQANYARFQEERRGFVRLAVQRWPNIVAEQTSRLRSRYESGELG